MKKIFLFFLILIVLGFSEIGGAQEVIIENPLAETTLEGIIERLVDLVFYIAIILAPLMIIISALMFVTARGRPEEVAKARQILVWSVIGFLIVLLSRGILAIIKQIIGIQ